MNRAVSLVVALVPTCAAVAQPTLFLTGQTIGKNDGGIWSTIAGSNVVHKIYGTPHDGRPMMVTRYADRVLWTTYYPGQLWSGTLDGADPVLLADQGEDTTTRAIEFAGGKMYWANENQGAIFRANPDGTDVQTVVSGYFGYDHGIWDFAILGDRVYWTSWISSDISTIGLDGSGYARIEVPGMSRSFCIEAAGSELVVAGDKSVSDWGRVVRLDPDGGDPAVIAEVEDESVLSLDIFGGRAYYGWSVGGQTYVSHVASVALGGGESRTELELEKQVQVWQIHVACTGDCQSDGVLDLFDYLCFGNLFVQGSLQADCDASGKLDIFDYLCFVNQFNKGC